MKKWSGEKKSYAESEGRKSVLLSQAWRERKFPISLLSLWKAIMLFWGWFGLAAYGESTAGEIALNKLSSSFKASTFDWIKLRFKVLLKAPNMFHPVSFANAINRCSPSLHHSTPRSWFPDDCSLTSVSLASLNRSIRIQIYLARHICRSTTPCQSYLAAVERRWEGTVLIW